MQFDYTSSSLRARYGNETILIEAWGNNALRVRSTYNNKFSDESKALSYAESNAEVKTSEDKAIIKNGKISCVVHKNAWMEFFKDDKSILKEYSRSFNGANEHSPCLNVHARDFKAVSGIDYSITARFEAQNGEKIYGMGQYQQSNLDLKGCVLELAQRNSQISIPFYISNKNYLILS